MSSSEGQKVRADPEGLNNPKTENPGMVTSDSLAAESVNEGGSFAATSDNRGPMAQPSYSTTANNTDVSNAVRLDPATDAEARQATEEWDEAALLNAGRPGGRLDPDSRGQEYGTGNAAPAPGYVANPAPIVGDTFKPKGQNLTEGGFDSDAPNASFGTDIGGRKDPGRVALNKFEEDNTPYAGGAGPRDEEITGPQQFGNLDETSA